MKREFFLIILIKITFIGAMTVQGQTALIKKSEEGISIKNMGIEAKVIGDIGITTYTIEVFNGIDRQISKIWRLPMHWINYIKAIEILESALD